MPPTPRALWETIPTERRDDLFATKDLSPTVDGEYLHWDQLLHRKPPSGLSHEEWWWVLKVARGLGKTIPLHDVQGRPFRFREPDPIPERLREIDLGAGGRIELPEEIVNQDTRDRYIVSSLVEEAITSSQLEGAATTRQVAKQMIRTGRPPRDRHERMILNNYRTMEEIRSWKDEPLTPELVLRIHKLITEQTLDDPSQAGRFRLAHEKIDVGDQYGEVFHQPPPAGQLAARMQSMCDFANGKTPGHFIHPAIRSIILHFWLGYDHPFADGNGRTARALFYWSMLRHGFWLFEFVSISHIIRKAPVQYGMAFLHTETDENDLTYFILYHLDVIRKAIDELHAYVKRKAGEVRRLERRTRSLGVLNHRQQALLSHALRNPRFQYTFKSHQRSHSVAYETARQDLLDLERRGLLLSAKRGKAMVFTPAADIEARLEHLGD